MYSVTESLVSWLAGLGYAASTRPPAEDPGEFVTVERTGGGTTDFVDGATFAVQCWAATEARAEEMSNAIREKALAGEPPEGVHSMRADSGPYRFYDESTRKPRYQTVYTCACRAL